MAGYKVVNRAEFVRERYERFLTKKEFLHNVGADPRSYVLTDLDSCYGGDKPVKDMVVCDMCNEDILEETFIMYEEDRVYHKKCIEGELPEVGLAAVNVLPFRIHHGRSKV